MGEHSSLLRSAAPTRWLPALACPVRGLVDGHVRPPVGRRRPSYGLPMSRTRPFTPLNGRRRVRLTLRRHSLGRDGRARSRSEAVQQNFGHLERTWRPFDRLLACPWMAMFLAAWRRRTGRYLGTLCLRFRRVTRAHVRRDLVGEPDQRPAVNALRAIPIGTHPAQRTRSISLPKLRPSNSIGSASGKAAMPSSM
jgi:hypothetical protein